LLLDHEICNYNLLSLHNCPRCHVISSDLHLELASVASDITVVIDSEQWNVFSSSQTRTYTNQQQKDDQKP